jgi:hypothetical protein
MFHFPPVRYYAVHPVTLCAPSSVVFKNSILPRLVFISGLWYSNIFQSYDTQLCFYVIEDVKPLTQFYFLVCIATCFDTKGSR